MKGIILVSLLAAFLLLAGCAAQIPSGQAAANPPGENDKGQSKPITTDKIIFTAPAQLEDGTVGKYYEYSFCGPKPSGANDLCGGISSTTNPTGGKGPYSFYLGSGVGFQPFGLSLSLNGVLSGTPAAAGSKTFQVCVKDIGGDFACQTVSLNIKQPAAGLAGRWEMHVNAVLNGPEGSFPAGCSMNQKMQLDLAQNGNDVAGTATNEMTKTTGCGSWSIDTEAPTTASLSGTLSAPSIKFTIGQTDYTGIISGGNMTGKMVTCKSPDPRCTCKSPDPRCPAEDLGLGGPLQDVFEETVNWYSGDFTAVRVG